jgi:MFS transporter, MHS family, citrate/tricarballylate:H+ symporter
MLKQPGMETAQQAGAAPAMTPLSLRQIGAVVAGNALEFYDFLVYAYFATQIGHTFFPGQSDGESLLLVLATFGVGFLTRPLGAVVIGIMGDVKGRKPAMLLSFSLMGISIVGLALTPSAHSIGPAAPILAILFRLLQGFALGGEVGPSSAWLLEAAPPARRAFYVSLQFASQWAAGLAAGLVGMALAHMLTPAALTQWGWRAAFLAGALVVPVGLIVRRRLPETLKQNDDVGPAPSLHLRAGLAGLLMLGGGTIATYTLSYLTTFANYTLGLSPGTAFGAAAVAGACGSIFNPLGGWLSDRLGRRPVMLAALGLLLAIEFPCFMVMVESRSALSLWIGAGVMASLLALATPSILTTLLENLPPVFRSGGIGLIYGMAISIFGGTTQFVVTWLTETTGSPYTPAAYLAAALALGLIGMAMSRETAPVCGGV